MNIALIFAGGTGQRMNTRTIPKQFLTIHGKPILVYTLEEFDQHPDIDQIVLVCLESWIERAKKIIKRFSLKKIALIVPGGDTGQKSIFQGLKAAKEISLGDENNIVLIHDGVRPLIDHETITACLECVHEHGNAVTITPAIETIFVKEDNSKQVGQIFNRSSCAMARAPQCFYLNDIYAMHLKALEENKTDFIDSAMMMQHYGYNLYMVDGPVENIKITTPTDFYLFRALLDAKENTQIFGI